MAHLIGGGFAGTALYMVVLQCGRNRALPQIEPGIVKPVAPCSTSYRYREYRGSVHMTCLATPISLSSPDISPIWTSLSAMT
jgi:hypothetical protein